MKDETKEYSVKRFKFGEDAINVGLQRVYRVV